jgi:hypothetical protein
LVLLAVTGEEIGDDGADAAGDCSADDNIDSMELASERVIGPQASNLNMRICFEVLPLLFLNDLSSSSWPYCLSTPLPSPVLLSVTFYGHLIPLVINRIIVVDIVTLWLQNVDEINV